MIRNLLESIEGIDVYPVIGLIIFMIFFIILLVWIFRLDKNYISEMKDLPLDTDNKDFSNLTGKKNGK